MVFPLPLSLSGLGLANELYFSGKPLHSWLPDEEVASDDEFDRNAYNYRTGNASDLEEYDELYDGDGMALSDDEGESTRYPWKAKP